MKIRVIDLLKKDAGRRIFLTTGISILISFAYAIFNGVVGFINNSVWHGSIFTYYVLLMVMKLVLVYGELHFKRDEKRRRKITNATYVLLILTTISMIAPSILLILNKRSYEFGLIPAITSATYTTYTITMSIINLSKARSNENVMVKQIRLINLINALMSILVLQNTMILANGGYGDGMRLLSIYTSIGIITAVIIIEIYSFVKTVKELSQK